MHDLLSWQGELATSRNVITRMNDIPNRAQEIKMNKFNILFISLVLSLLFACSGDKTASTETKTDAAATASSGQLEKTLGDAEKAYQDAVSQGAAWRDTDAILKKARAAAAGNDIATATQLAQQALEQSQMAMKQLQDQKNAGPHLF